MDIYAKYIDNYNIEIAPDNYNRLSPILIWIPDLDDPDNYDKGEFAETGETEYRTVSGYNTNVAMLLEDGWKIVRETVKPAPEDGWDYRPVYNEIGDAIDQNWEPYELPIAEIDQNAINDFVTGMIESIMGGV